MTESLEPQSPIAVANFVISVAKKRNLPVTNLQLQKVLFFLQGFTLSKYKAGIVNGTFSKWQYGPVQKDVYRTFRDNGASPITDEYVDAYFDVSGNFKTQTPRIDNINNDQKEILTTFVLKLLKIPAWKLVNWTHEDPSWHDFKSKIMNYTAPDYVNAEILTCFQNNETKFG